MTTLILNAEQLLSNLGRMPSSEREKFFSLLGQKTSETFDADNLRHEQVFGHLKNAAFTATEAAEYLEVSMATFRRYVKADKIKSTMEVGSSHLYPLSDLRALKKALNLTKKHD